MRPVLVLQHQDDVGPGNLAEWLTAQGIPFVVRDVTEQGAHDETDWAAVVVLGSKESVYDTSVPWLAWEKAELQRQLDAGRPVLGICFGAQLLAQLTGGSVSRARTPERGWITVDGVEGIGGSWFAWHGDEITAPATAQVLATSSACVQAFGIGPHLGVQFHPEVTTDQVDRWTTTARRQAELLALGSTREVVLAQTAARAEDAGRSAAQLYAKFFSNLAVTPERREGRAHPRRL